MVKEVISNEGNNPLATEKVGKLIIKFAIPAVLSMLVDAVYNIADQIFIGHGVGYLGIAATTVAAPLVTIVLAISTMLGIGGSVYTSMRMGENRSDDAEKMLGSVFTLSVVVGILIMVLGFIFLEPMVYFFGATDASLQYILEYTRVVLIGIPFSMLAVTLSSMARSDGSPVFVMGCFLTGSIIDLISNPIYIFVFGWGVKGAAISTVTSQILTALVFTFYFLKKGKLRLKMKHILPASSMLMKIVAFGVPACAIQIGETVVQIVLNNSLRTYGANSVGSELAQSTVGIILRVGSVMISVCVGIAIGIQPLLGFNKGAGLSDRVKQIYGRAAMIGTVVSVIGWLLCELFPTPILGIFGLNEPEYIEFAIRSMRICFLGMFTVGFQVITANFFLAVGQSIKSLVLSVLRPVLITIPLLWTLPRIWGLDGILYANAAAGFITPAIMAIFIVREFRKNKGALEG